MEAHAMDAHSVRGADDLQKALITQRHARGTLAPGARKRAGKCAKGHIFLDSSMVEHSAVNRRVAGSSPARGVYSEREARFAEDL